MRWLRRYAVTLLQSFTGHHLNSLLSLVDALFRLRLAATLSVKPTSSSVISFRLTCTCKCRGRFFCSFLHTGHFRTAWCDLVSPLCTFFSSVLFLSDFFFFFLGISSGAGDAFLFLGAGDVFLFLGAGDAFLFLGVGDAFLFSGSSVLDGEITLLPLLSSFSGL